MVFFDKFNTDNFNVDNQELEVQPVTTSELKKEYAQLGIIKSWNWGEQTARRDSTIISRTYKELTFSSDANDFDLVDAGYEDIDKFGGRYYWRVLHEFKETEYYSSLEEEFLNFKIWEKSINEFQMEITYDNLPTKFKNAQNEDSESIIIWNRPKTTASFIDTGCPIMQDNSTPTETGDGPWFSNGSTVSNNSNNSSSITTSCSHYNSLPIPFYLTFDAGKSLGASIEESTIAPNKIYISKNPTLITGEYIESNKLGSILDPHKMNYRYLILKWDNPGKDTLRRVKVTFRGNEKYRSFLPLLRDNDPEFIEHLEITPYISHASINQATRYKPPNKYEFPDNFWNDVEDTPIINYEQRIGITPAII